jgi:hypothetical protein
MNNYYQPNVLIEQARDIIKSQLEEAIKHTTGKPKSVWISAAGNPSKGYELNLSVRGIESDQVVDSVIDAYNELGFNVIENPILQEDIGEIGKMVAERQGVTKNIQIIKKKKQRGQTKIRGRYIIAIS